VTLTRFDALLFDLDGTLIDSMPLHTRAWHAWFAAQGVALAGDAQPFAASAGRLSEDILADYFPHATLTERAAMAEAKEARYRTLAETDLQPVAGALALLDACAAEGFKLAICTAAPLANIAVADARFGLRQRVQAVVSPADGLRGKPHPDIFLHAAQQLGVAPARCLVFEDAPLGIEAAQRAGMTAVAVTTSLAAAGFAAYPNLLATVPDLAAFDRHLLHTPQERTTP